MKSDLPANPTDLAIDMDQWRRDIQTFAQTTQQALDAIVAELSNQCSGGISPNPNLDLGAEIPPFESPFSRPGRSSSLTGDDGDRRLEDLKSQLAERITKSQHDG